MPSHKPLVHGIEGCALGLAIALAIPPACGEDRSRLLAHYSQPMSRMPNDRVSHYQNIATSDQW